ncbi:MAG: hypothetical protein ACI4UV_11945, partial [Victivallales bacterium]
MSEIKYLFRYYDYLQLSAFFEFNIPFATGKTDFRSASSRCEKSFGQEAVRHEYSCRQPETNHITGI